MERGCQAHTSPQGSERKSGLWVFGYGSLVWRPGLDFVERREGCVRGFRRVWYQGGTPEKPGRTVTLEAAEEDAEVWGAAYRLECEECGEEGALAYLDHREKQYDRRVRLDVIGRDGQTVVAPNALVYIGTPHCENYLGIASPEEIARQIAAAAGPSGSNSEYLFNLAGAMREMGVKDEELFELEALCRRIQENQEKDTQ